MSLVLFLLANTVHADVSDSNNQSNRTPIAEELIQRYCIPYGAVGFVSHGITLYLFICFCCYRRPFPWISLGNNRIWRWFIGVTMLIASTALGIVAISRLSDQPGSLITQIFMNAGLSITCACVMMGTNLRRKTELVTPPSGPSDSAPVERRTSDVESLSSQTEASNTFVSSFSKAEDMCVQSKSNNPQDPQMQTHARAVLMGISITSYFCFMAVGVTGLGFVITECWDHAVELVTVSGFSIMIYTLVLLVIAMVVSPNNNSKSSIFTNIFSFVILIPAMLLFFSPFYSDWILGAIARNFAGLPTTTDSVCVGIYWAFFVTSLLPLAAF
jgi:hypothetical protein